VNESRWGDLTWTTVEAATAEPVVAILPLGAVEAHGPHLPLVTDGVIARAMARLAVEDLGPEVRALVLPALDYSAAPFAAGFPGTLSVQPETITQLVCDIGSALLTSGVGLLALANAHLDPAHLRSLHEATRRLETETALRVAFPDLTRKPWASRLTDEFKTGACHAGRYESSVVMAERPDLVDDAVRRGLPPNPASLAVAIREGKSTFEEAGGSSAYFGWPAEATEGEGKAVVAVLGQILADAVRQRLGITAASELF
jgi:creatinine amidohydrolase